MSSKEVKKFFVVGIGNPLRCDDGLGPLIADEIAKRNIPGVKVVTSALLNLELLEDAVGYSKLLVIDASVEGEGMVFKKVLPLAEGQLASSHYFSPESFLAMAKELYDKDVLLYLCSIRGRNFEVGNALSVDVLELIPHAVAEIDAFLREK